MRTTVIVVAVVLGCEGNSDYTLGECAESTTEWWPLRPGSWWRYEQLELGESKFTEKYTEVQYASAIHGLLGDETAARTWRANVDRDETDAREAGWRWVIATEQELAWRADVWVGAAGLSAPCEPLGSDDDPRLCTEVEPSSDRTYFPSKLRLDLREEHLCERSAWTSTYVERKIEIGEDAHDVPELENCHVDTWRTSPGACDYLDTEITDEWNVRYVDHTIQVPAGPFEHCLCVRRKNAKGDVTYCFAEGIGKVYEVENNDHVECLADYHIDADTEASSPDWELECDPNQLED
jgi:hypothetical protein